MEKEPVNSENNKADKDKEPVISKPGSALEVRVVKMNDQVKVAIDKALSQGKKAALSFKLF